MQIMGKGCNISQIPIPNVLDYDGFHSLPSYMMKLAECSYDLRPRDF